MKIIHTGDIHLDSPFTSLNPIEAEKRRNALRSAFSSMILYAKTEKADLFLISGDLFDDECVTKDTCLTLCKEMASVPECSFIITPGNHDPYRENSPYNLVTFPENVYIFTSPEITKVEIGDSGVCVYGSAYLSDTKEGYTLEKAPLIDKTKINILMHHGDVDAMSSPYSPISMRQIEDSGFDYIALGHVHKGTEIKKAGNTYFAYCGCIEGRDFGECGFKGAIVGEIQKGNVNLHHVRFSSKRYEIVSHDVTGCSSFSDCIADIAAKCAEFGEDTLLRVELTGVVSESFNPDTEALQSIVSKPSYLEIKDRTLALLNMKNLKEDKTLAGEFYRALEEKLFSEDEEERRIASGALKYGLRAIYGLEIKA
ncbi:MAG: DNA repair exonuclease [Clostridia bacterium]|nr:DNA repair exonuclease [Clostridia bacterium]